MSKSSIKLRLRTRIVNLIRAIPFLDSQIQHLRKRILSKNGGYPNWVKILAFNDIYKEISHNDFSINRNQKVLMATSIGSHLPAMQMETTLAVALHLRGAVVECLLCDGVLPGCQMCEPRFFPNTKRFAKYGPSKDLCDNCYAPGKTAYKGIGLPIHTYSDHLTDDDIALADKLSLETSVSDIEVFKLGELNLGEHVKAGALRFYARASIDDEPFAEIVLRRYLKAAILTALSVKKLLLKEHYDVVVFHHGIYVPQGIIGEVARQLGIRVVNWNPAYRKNCFIFSHGDTYHHTLMDEPVSVWEDMPWSSEREDTIIRYLRSRWDGENDWIRFQEKPYFEKDRILAEIGCDAIRPIIGCLTNVMWDAQLHYPANAFANMLEWLVFTVHYFAKCPQMQLVIRVHPAEISGSVPTKQPVVAELHKRFPKLPDNVFIVPPESNISTYVLSELCDSVIIYGTKTGVELTSVGIPVIVAGEAWIRNKGLTTDAVNPENYKNILDLLPTNARLRNATVSRARKYAYHFFFRRMIPIEVFEKGPGWPPYRFTGTLNDLVPGKDAGLDCVCDGIVEGKPFIFDYKKAS